MITITGAVNITYLRLNQARIKLKKCFWSGSEEFTINRTTSRRVLNRTTTLGHGFIPDLQPQHQPPLHSADCSLVLSNAATFFNPVKLRFCG